VITYDFCTDLHGQAMSSFNYGACIDAKECSVLAEYRKHGADAKKVDIKGAIAKAILLTGPVAIALLATQVNR
jgi:hypothetical protein